MRGAGRSAGGGQSAGLGEHGDGVSIPGASAPLHMRGELERPGAPGPQCLGGALVRSQAPPGARGLVGVMANERMSEREPARLIRRPHGIGRNEHVERLVGRRRIEPRELGREIQIERIAGHRGPRRAVDGPAAGAPRELGPAQQLGHRRPHHLARLRLLATELQQQERVARALRMHLGDALGRRARWQQPCRVIARQAAERDARGGVRTDPGQCRGAQRRAQVVRTVRDHDQDRRGRRPRGQCADRVHRGVVGPVQIVEKQQDRARLGAALEEAAQLAMQRVAVRRLGGLQRVLEPANASRNGANGASCSNSAARPAAQHLHAGRLGDARERAE